MVLSIEHLTYSAEKNIILVNEEGRKYTNIEYVAVLDGIQDIIFAEGREYNLTLLLRNVGISGTEYCATLSSCGKDLVGRTIEMSYGKEGVRAGSVRISCDDLLTIGEFQRENVPCRKINIVKAVSSGVRA